MRKVKAFEGWGWLWTISLNLDSDRRVDSQAETQSESSPERHSLSPCESPLYYLLIISKPPPCHRKSCSLMKYEHVWCCQLTPVPPRLLSHVQKNTIPTPNQLMQLWRKWSHTLDMLSSLFICLFICRSNINHSFLHSSPQPSLLLVPLFPWVFILTNWFR